MYDELIKDLRYLAKVYSICENENTKEYDLAVKAADAIEKLNMELLNAKEFSDYADAIKELKPKWIPVTERLPEEHSIVLLYSYGDVVVGTYDSEYKEFRELNGFHRLCTHWMPRPVPPKEET